jgi:hypothetical protein
MSVRIFTNPVTGKPWPTLTDARPAKKNHDEQEGEKGTGGGEERGGDKEMGKEEEETEEENMNNN